MLNFFQFIVFMSLFTIGLFAQQRIPIAVMDLDGLGISKIESKIISVRLRTHLINTGKFVVLEREKMEEILSEQGFQLSGCTSNECVVQAGQLLGVKQIVAGSVGKIGNIFSITVKTIDVQSGEIIKSATEDCECKIETVLTTSVKNVVQILSGTEVKPLSYIERNPNIKNENKLSNNINEWEILGLSRDEYIGYKRSGLTFNNWLIKSKSLNPQKALLLSTILPGTGQYYSAEYMKGILQQSIITISFGLGFSFRTNESHDEKILAISLRSVGVIVWLWSIFDSKSSAENYNAELKKQFSNIFDFQLNDKLCSVDFNFSQRSTFKSNLTINF